MQNEPDMPIKNVIEDINKTMNYSISYKMEWHARAKAIKMVFGDWDESYRQLPKFMHTLQSSNPGTIVTWNHRYTAHTTSMAYSTLFSGLSNPSSMALDIVVLL